MINPKLILSIPLGDKGGSPFSQRSVAETINSIFSLVFTNELQGEMPEYAYFDHQLTPDLSLTPMG